MHYSTIGLKRTCVEIENDLDDEEINMDTDYLSDQSTCKPPLYCDNLLIGCI